MIRLQFINFGSDSNWKLETVTEIFNKVSDYVSRKNLKDVEILSVEDCTWSDNANQRYDIEISYKKSGVAVMQKLLMLKGEIVDGESFHKRFEEFYSRTDT